MASSDGSFSTGGAVAPSDTTQQLQNYWTRVLHEIKNLQPNDFKTQELPLARIKKIMKLDEDVKMISSEAPLLFSKACEIFIRELTLRAWLHTEDNKRRTQQRNDIAMAISKFDQFDFLIDIVPRDELKPAKRTEETTPRTGMMPDQVQLLLQLAQQTQQSLQTNTTAATPAQTTAQQPQTQIIQLQTPQGIIQQPVQIQTQQGGGDATQQQQILQIQPQAVAQPQQAQVQQVQVQQPAQQQQQQQSQTTQVYQQIVTPSGEVQNVPIQLTQTQLMAIQQQMQGKQPGQQIIIQTQQPTTTQSVETSTAGTVDQTQFSNATQPLFQIQQTMPQQILVQPSDGSGDQTVDLTDVST